MSLPVPKQLQSQIGRNEGSLPVPKSVEKENENLPEKNPLPLKISPKTQLPQSPNTPSQILEEKNPPRTPETSRCNQMGQPDDNLQSVEGIAKGLPPIQVHSSVNDLDEGHLGGVTIRGGAVTSPNPPISQKEKSNEQQKKIVVLKPPKTTDKPNFKRKTRTKFVHDSSQTKITTMFTRKEKQNNTQEIVKNKENEQQNANSTDSVLDTKSVVQRVHTDKQGNSTSIKKQQVQFTQADLPARQIQCNTLKFSLSNNNPGGTILDQTTPDLKTV